MSSCPISTARKDPSRFHVGGGIASACVRRLIKKELGKKEVNQRGREMRQECTREGEWRRETDCWCEIGVGVRGTKGKGIRPEC